MPDLQLSTLRACGACDPLQSPSLAVFAEATGWRVKASCDLREVQRCGGGDADVLGDMFRLSRSLRRYKQHAGRRYPAGSFTFEVIDAQARYEEALYIHTAEDKPLRLSLAARSHCCACCGKRSFEVPCPHRHRRQGLKGCTREQDVWNCNKDWTEISSF